MDIKELKIGFAFTGAYCVFDLVFPELKNLVAEGAEVVPIVSFHVAETDSRYGNAADFLLKMNLITGNEVVKTITSAELLNKNLKPIDILVIAPCTASTLSKLTDGDSDTPVLMIAKEQFRNNKPVVLGIATNDGLGLSAKNIGILLATKNVYFIPFGQDNYETKPNSLIARFDLLQSTVLEAIQGRQYQPVLEKF